MLSRHRNAGYTLIEVLIAMVILSLALSVLLRIFSGGLRNIGVSDEYTHAVLIAESRLASAGLSSPLVPGVLTGIDGGKFRWTQTVQDYVARPDSGATGTPLQAYAVTVAVEWPDAAPVRRINLSSIKLADTTRRRR